MHLSVGYGLDLTELTDDPAEVMDYSRLEDEDLYQRFLADVLRFAEDTDDLMEKMIFHEKMKPPEYLADMIVYDGEFGLADKVLFLPAGSREKWTRYGDLLDIFAYEAEHPGNTDLVPVWTEKHGTLYPYVGLMKPNPDMPLGIEKYWVPCYMDHPEHKDAVAWAPWHLWFLLKHLFDLSNEDTTNAFMRLRPTIYRYWG